MDSSANQTNKRLVWDWWESLQNAQASQLQNLTATMIAPDANWCGPDPINTLQGPAAFFDNFWRPLLYSFPDMERQTILFFGGQSNGRRDGDLSHDGKMWVTGTGSFSGTFTEDYLGIPATGKRVNIRWGEFCRVENGKIVETYFLLDFIGLMLQAGFNVLPHSLGADGDYAAPAAVDGIIHKSQDEQTSAYTLEHMRRFIFEGLNGYDESNLASMGMADFFDPDVKWYGPGGIGDCYTLKEFEDYHQKQWLHAFPDREVQDLTSLFAEGAYSGGPGWAGVKATHRGEYKGVAATGNSIEVNGLDWWKREGEQLVENWVFVDMVHLFRQFGVDLFGRLADQVNKR